MSAQNASTIVADRLIERGLYLERYKAGLNRQVLEQLSKLEDSLTRELASAFAQKIPNASVKVRRLERLLSDTRQIIRDTYRGSDELAGKELLQLAKNEQIYAVGALQQATVIDFTNVTLNYDQLTKLVDGTLIEGAKSAEWWRRQSDDVVRRFSDQMRMGVMRGETLDQLVARVQGTQARAYTDGIMTVTRRNAEALVRSSVQVIANETRTAFFRANPEVVTALQWCSVMDGRTCWSPETKILMADGTQRPISKIRDGEFVVGGLSGKPCRVLGKITTEVNSSLAVYNGCNYVGRTTDEHRILTPSGWTTARGLCVPPDIPEREVLCRNHARHEEAAPRAHSKFNRETKRRIVQCDSETWYPENGCDCGCAHIRGSVCDGEGEDWGIGHAGTGRVQHDGGRRWRCGHSVGCEKTSRGEAAPNCISSGHTGSTTCERKSRRTESVSGKQNILFHRGRESGHGEAFAFDVALQSNCGESETDHRPEARKDVSGNGVELERSRVSGESERCERSTASGIACKSRMGGTSPGCDGSCYESEMGRSRFSRQDEGHSHIGRSEGVGIARRIGGQGNTAIAGETSIDAREGSRCRVAPVVQSGDPRRDIVIDQAKEVHAATARAVRTRGRVKIVSLTIDGDESYVAGGLIVHNTPICIALNGKMWSNDGEYRPIGHDKVYPGPTAHWGCRSVQVPVVGRWKDITAGMDPDELDAEFRDQLREEGFSESEIAAMKRSTRASMDGQVAKEITFDEWLSGKSHEFQDQLLGAGRGKLFRDGKITLTDLIDQSGRPLTIDQLERLSHGRRR